MGGVCELAKRLKPCGAWAGQGISQRAAQGMCTSAPSCTGEGHTLLWAWITEVCKAACAQPAPESGTWYRLTEQEGRTKVGQSHQRCERAGSAPWHSEVLSVKLPVPQLPGGVEFPLKDVGGYIQQGLMCCITWSSWGCPRLEVRYEDSFTLRSPLSKALLTSWR